MTQCQIEWRISADANARYARQLDLDVPNANAVHEIELRRRPIREQWEARGPGLLRIIRRQLPWLDYPPTVAVHLVEPFRGGGALLVNNEIHFEAVLANPHPRLPEVLRIAWMIARSVTKLSPEVTGPAGEEVLSKIGLIPDVLFGGEQVELTICDTTTIHNALTAWHCVSEAQRDFSERIFAWWRNRGDDTQTAWRSGLVELA